MEKSDIEKIQVLYNEVFDENGNVKLCGRMACKRLMQSLNEVFENVDFGNMDAGFMNVEVVKEYYNKLLLE